MKKEEELLLRVFKMIAKSHFNDHKLLPWYCKRFDFDRGLGDDIANYIQSKNPEYYHKKRKDIEKERKSYAEKNTTVSGTDSSQVG